MKKIILPSLLLLLGAGAAIAQCGKKSVMKSNKTEYFDSSGNIQRTVDETALVEIDGSNIKIAPGDDGRVMAGPIKSDSCKWKIPFKEGKTVIKTDLTDERGEVHKDVTLTIEGKNGVITLLFEAPEIPDKKIKITAVSFEEKK